MNPRAMTMVELCRAAARHIDDQGGGQFQARVVSNKDTQFVKENFQEMPTVPVLPRGDFFLQVVYVRGETTRLVNLRYANLSATERKTHNYAVDRTPQSLADEIMTKLKEGEQRVH